jgi:NADPH-dependent glutamate synthase beta subunit-like oxidoreductase
VLVVGAGPAGLSAAWHLRLGHAVTIVEAGPQSGGMMRFGIPKYRLPREVLDAEVQAHPRHGRRDEARQPQVDDLPAP